MGNHKEIYTPRGLGFSMSSRAGAEAVVTRIPQSDDITERAS